MHKITFNYAIDQILTDIECPVEDRIQARFFELNWLEYSSINEQCY